MKNRTWMTLAALPAAIGLLYGLDLWLEHLRQIAAQDFNFTLLFWMIPVINLLYAAVVLGLFLMATQTIRRWMGSVYAISGVVLLIYPSLRMTVLANLPLVIRNVLPVGNTLLDPTRGLWLMGAFILVMGGWMIVRQDPAAESPAG